MVPFVASRITTGNAPNQRKPESEKYKNIQEIINTINLAFPFFHFKHSIKMSHSVKQFTGRCSSSSKVLSSSKIELVWVTEWAQGQDDADNPY